MSMEKKTVFYIVCQTGCNCCQDVNHSRGFYATREDAQRRIDRWKKGIHNPLASQYSRFGNYSIYETTVEEISDNRLIVGYTVIPENEFFMIEVAEDGSTRIDDTIQFRFDD